MIYSHVGRQATSAAASLTLGDPPSIDTDPVASSGCEGDDVTLTVVASGTPPLTYQWRRDGVDIAGATAASLTLNAITVDDGGSYDVVVTNDCTSVTSAAATVTVDVNPSITTPPADVDACPGDPVTFTVTADGTPTLTYQWRRNGVALTGETDATLTIASAAPANAGSYDVIVSNACADVTSASATLTATSRQAASSPPRTFSSV